MLFRSLQVSSHEHQVVVSENLNIVSNDSLVALTVLHEVYLHLLMFMERICMLFLMPFHEMVAVLLSKSGYFGNHIVHSLS